MGFVKKGSKMSALAGGSIGAGLLYSAVLMGQATQLVLGLRIACGMPLAAARAPPANRCPQRVPFSSHGCPHEWRRSGLTAYNNEPHICC